MLYILVTAANWRGLPHCVTSLPSWSCGFDSRRPLSTSLVSKALTGNCGDNCAASRPGTCTIPASAGCAIHVTPTTSWDSPAPRPKPRPSRPSWRRSCATNLRSNSTSPRRWLPMPRTQAARYLGYEITVQHADRRITAGRRAVGRKIASRVPLDVIKAQARLDDHDIIWIYGGRVRDQLLPLPGASATRRQP
jgi:hypothetical protein